MKQLTALLLIPALCVLLYADPGANAKVIGTWYNTEKDGKIEIYECDGGKLCGKIVWLADPNKEDGSPKTDENNPDETKHNDPVMGMDLMYGFEYDGNDKWDEGSIYDPKSGKTYSCKMTLKSPSELDVRGYVGISMFGRTENWTKAE